MLPHGLQHSFSRACLLHTCTGLARISWCLRCMLLCWPADTGWWQWQNMHNWKVSIYSTAHAAGPCLVPMRNTLSVAADIVSWWPYPAQLCMVRPWQLLEWMHSQRFQPCLSSNACAYFQLSLGASIFCPALLTHRCAATTCRPAARCTRCTFDRLEQQQRCLQPCVCL